MFRLLRERLGQKYRTMKFPLALESMPESFLGLPEISNLTEEEFKKLSQLCPADAFVKSENAAGMDIGKCVFCGECSKNSESVKFKKEYSLGSVDRKDLIITTDKTTIDKPTKDFLFKKLLKKSLKLRQVSAGGCNACEADVNVLGTVGWDLGRFGIQFVASPRHADGILVTGPVSKNMETALLKTYEATPKPKIVIACGSCAIDGGPFYDSEEVVKGVDKLLGVDLFIPGCPPHPATILIALLKFLGKL